MVPLAEGDALCSYVSADGSASGTNATLPKAVAALNKAGGGTLTVTQSGIVAADQIIVTSDITILAQEENPVTVTVNNDTAWDSLFTFALESETGHKGSLTFGEKGMSDGLLTFNGGNERDAKTSFVNYDSYNVPSTESNLCLVNLHDGVVIKGFTGHVLGGSWKSMIDFEMDGGKITDNHVPTEMIVVMEFKMTGGEICNNSSYNTGGESLIFDDDFEYQVDRDQTVIGGTAKIYNNSVTYGGVWKELIYSYTSVILKDDAEIKDCVSSAAVRSAIDVTMQGRATIDNCIIPNGQEGSTGGVFGETTVVMKDSSKIINSGNGKCEAGGAYCYGSITLEDNAYIENCSSTYGYAGGLRAGDSVTIKDSAHISDCSIEEGDYTTPAGGVYADLVAMEGQAYVKDCTAGDDGVAGVYAYEGFTMSETTYISDCSGVNAGYGGVYVRSYQSTGFSMSGKAYIENCSAKNYGGACVFGTATLTDSARISNCQGQKTAGLYAYDMVTMEDDSKIENCTAKGATSGAAGGVYTPKNMIMRNNASISGCTVEGGYAGGVYALDGLAMYDQTSIINCKNSSNRQFCAGGAYIYDGDLILQGSEEEGKGVVIQGCSAAEEPTSSGYAAGGILVRNVDENRVTLSNVLIKDCSANYGYAGGLYAAKVELNGQVLIQECSTDYGDVGGLYTNEVALNGQVLIQGCFTGHGDAGGLYARTVNLYGTVDVETCSAKDDGYAGGVYAGTLNLYPEGKLTIKNSSAVDGYSGGLYASTANLDGSLTVDGCSITDGGSAGGVYAGTLNLNTQGSLAIKNCTSTDGSAGGMRANTANLNGASAVIEGCSATDGGVGGVSAGTAILNNVLIKNCSVTDGNAGGLYVWNQLTMKGTSRIESCRGTLSAAGGIYLQGDGTLEDTALITDCHTTSPENIPVYAGGIYSNGSLTLGQNAKVTNCSGPVGGIICGIAWGDAITVTIDGEISGNSGIVGGGISAWKGANVVIASSANVCNNAATRAGGGIAIWNGVNVAGGDIEENQKTVLTMQGGLITQNTAPLGGGIYAAGYMESGEIGGAYEGKKAGPCFVNISGGTITGNTAANPKGGTATEFHGGGVFLGWDVETNVSGAINISSNTDANGNPSDLYLRKDPDYTVIDPAEEPEEDLEQNMNILKQFVADAAKAQFDAEKDLYKDQIMNVLSDDDLVKALPYLVEQGAIGESWLSFKGPFTDEDKTKLCNEYMAYLDLNAPQAIAEYQVWYLDDYIEAYRQKCDFVPTYEQFKAWYIDIALEYQKYELRAEITEMTREDLTLAAIALGIISSGETYTGTKEDFLSAVLQVYKKQYETDPDMDESITEAYCELWDVAATPTSTIQDARLHVTDALTGSQIGVTAEGAQNGRIIAVGTDTYTITKADLAVFTSNDPGYAVVWHPKESNQLMLNAKGHIISAHAGTGGSISPSGSVSVLEGNSQPFTITPASGYHISDVTVDGISKGAISTYTFENVTAAHTIEATFAKDSSGGSSGGGSGTHNDYTLRYETNGGDRLSNESKSYSWDKPYEKLPVPARDGYVFEGWYYDSKLTDPVEGDVDVNRTTVTLYAKWSKDEADPDNIGVSDWLNTTTHDAYLSGYGDGTFGPGNSMTRAEVAQMFYNLLLDKDIPVTVDFSDIPDDAWYADAVNTLASLGILTGIGNNEFAPDRAITRAEFTAIAMRFTNGNVSGENIFSDVSADDWFYDQVVGSIQYGWITGYEDGTFRPNTTIARAEVTTIVNRMLGRSADVDYVDRHKDDLRLFPDVSQDYWAYYQIVEATNAHDYTKEGNTESWSKLK